MIIPIRCYSCGKVVAHLWEPYVRLLDEDFTENEALDALGLVRYCCRRMIMTHIDQIDNMMPYHVPVIGTMPRLRPSMVGGGAGSAASVADTPPPVDAAPPANAPSSPSAPRAAATRGLSGRGGTPLRK